MKEDRKISNFLIMPQFQLTLVGVNILIMTIAFGIIFYQVYSSFDQLYAVGKGLRLPKNSAFFSLLRNQEEAIQYKLIIAAVISYIFSFIVTVVISHKLSGPIYGLKNYFLDIYANGHDKDLKFRKGDHYTELQDAVNKGIERIKK